MFAGGYKSFGLFRGLFLRFSLDAVYCTFSRLTYINGLTRDFRRTVKRLQLTES